MQANLFNPGTSFRADKLRLGRQARQLTQRDLAAATGVTQAFISMIEDRERTPSAEQAQIFAEVLRFPPSFFEQPDYILGTGIGELYHRRKKSLSSKQLDYIHAWMNITVFAVRRFLRAVDWPPCQVPTWSLGVDVPTAEKAAEALRAQWQVPSGPLQSVSGLLEFAGVLIVPTTFPSSEIDGIGLWPTDLPPVIFVNQQIRTDRLRFTLAHELAHLVLHQRSALSSVSSEIEDQANEFAGAFLLPRRESRPHLQRLDLTKLATQKRHWKVSMSAIIMRARQINTITSVEEKRLWSELARHGWKTIEPELPDTGDEPIGALYTELVDLHRNELGYSDRTISDLIHLDWPDAQERILPKRLGLRVIGRMSQ